VTSGIRIGTPAITTRGMKEEDMAPIVELVDEVIMNHDNEDVLVAVKKKVYDLMAHRPLFAQSEYQS
jgi:glycine hydroxymethyltransferase